MKKILLIPILFILCISFAYAASFESEVVAVKDTITLDESAQFTMVLKSNSSDTEELRIYTPNVEWNVPTKTLTLEPNFEITEDIDITPSKYIEPGVHGVHVNIKNDLRDELQQKLVTIIVTGEGEEEYKPSVSMESDFLRQIIPGDFFTIKLTIKNQNPLDLQNLSLIVSSDLNELNEIREIDLGPVNSEEAKKVIALDYQISAQQQPKAYQVSFQLKKGNETIASIEPKVIEVESSVPEFEESIDKVSGFMKTYITATYKNTGNVRNTQTIRIPVSWFQAKFTKTDAEIIKEDGQRYIAKDIELGPNETATMTATTNYRIVLYIVILLIIILLIYLKFRKRLKIRKTVANISTEEGGISKLKIMIDIVNTSGKELKDVKIVDIVPSIAEVKKEFAEGTLKPASILKHSSKGTVLKWNIPELAPGEERLISYDIKSKLSIIGSFNLPKARIKFTKDGKQKTHYSNSVGISD